MWRIAAGIGVLGMIFVQAGRGADNPPLSAATPGAVAPGSPDYSLSGAEEGFSALAKTVLDPGHEAQAVAYLAADAVVAGNEEVLGGLRWSPTLKRPIVVARWGLATMNVQRAKASDAKAPLKAAEGPPAGALGATQGNIFSAAAAASPPSATFRPAAPPGVRHPPKKAALPADVKGQDFSLNDPIGFWRQQVGVPLLDAIQTRANRGDFGTWLKDNEKKAPASNVPEAVPASPAEEPPFGAAAPAAAPDS